MAMVISGKAKAVIAALLVFFLLAIVLVTGSTKGWFVPQRFHGERVAARIQVGWCAYISFSSGNDGIIFSINHFVFLSF